jgi:hypothetical protein
MTELMNAAESILFNVLMRARAANAKKSHFRDYAYCGMEEFLLQHGRWSVVIPFPEGERHGAPRVCFGNAIMLAAEKGYEYIEGVAVSPKAKLFHHGWNIDREGRLIDSTWMNTGLAYLGVQFSLGRADHASWEDDASILHNPRNQDALFKNPWHGEDYGMKWPESAAMKVLRMAVAELNGGQEVSEATKEAIDRLDEEVRK